MKRIIYSLFTLCLLAVLLGGCGKKTDNTPQHEQASSAKEDQEETSSVEENEEEKELYVPDISKSALKDEEEKDSRISLKKFDMGKSVFRLEGITYSLPFSYARISGDWSFDLKDYGLDESFSLQPGQRTTDNIVLHNPKTDYTLTVGLYNPYDVEISVLESQVWSVTVSIKDISNAPKLLLPGKLTWHDTIADVTLAYSDPTTPFTHDLETGMFYYSYVKDYSRYLNLEISEEDGIVSFTMKCYE